MLNLAFNSPWYLLLLAGLPLLWWASWRTLSGLGRVRRAVAITLRTLVYLLLVAALAETQWVRVSQRLTVLYLLDQSLSVSPAQTDAMVQYINEAIRKQRDRGTRDMAGVIVFGREGIIEIPPLDEDQQLVRVETLVDRDYTNLASALKLAQASFPHDTAKRIVLVTDGNQNLGDAREQARALADAGIGIDVVPIRSAAQGEVAVEKVTLPGDLRRGQPFDLRVVLNNTASAGQEPRPIEGRLQVVRKSGDRQETISDSEITVEPGKRVFSVREELALPDFYTYEARFIPKNPLDDTLPQNNAASAFTHVQGSGQVLVLEDWENKGEFDFMVERLRAMNMEVTLRSTRPEELFSNLTQLQPFDTVLLANVPREHFSDEQVDMLVRNTQNLGSGLVMLGGPESFGAGGWSNTPLEAAMPVDFQIKNAKVKPVGALAMIMHASELAQGNYWQTLVAMEALKTLGEEDYCGVIHWGQREEWLWPKGMLPVGANRKMMLAMLDRMTPGDMPDFEASMKMAMNDFRRLTQAATKHMIIISDGDPNAPDYSSRGSIAGLKALNVKVSTVAIGTHGPAGSSRLRSISDATGGKYYVVTNAATLPRIYQKEARRVARPLLFERDPGFQPQVRYEHEMIRGIEQQLPPITGYVRTTPKDNPLVEVSLVSPLPEGDEEKPILASWTYGLGKAAAFMTDTGKRWATAWTAWQNYDRLFSQIVRWSMRPTADDGKFNVVTDVQDGKVKLVVTALDSNDEFLNFLTMNATVLGPDMKPISVDVKQTAPGRYVGEFDAGKMGTYMLMVSPGAGRSPVRAGVSIPYSDEFRERETNEALLASLAETTPKQGAAGQLIDAPATLPGAERLEELLKTNTFRHDLVRASSSQDIWHWLAMAASCLFFADVFVRRVSVSFDWVPKLSRKLTDRLLRRPPKPDATVTIQRLRSRKAEVTQELEQKRASLRFEPTADEPADLSALDEGAVRAPVATATRKKAETLQPEATPESYTERLLKAKQKAQRDMKKDDHQESN